jgi:hypothetical protein
MAVSCRIRTHAVVTVVSVDAACELLLAPWRRIR